MTAKECREKIDRLAPEASDPVKWLVAEWNPNGVIERGYLSLRGPALRVGVENLRRALATEEATGYQIQPLVDRVENLLNGTDMVLSGGATVGCGCLHT